VKDVAPQTLGIADDGVVLRLQPGGKLAEGGLLDGVLVLTSADKSVQALQVAARPGAVPPARFKEGATVTLALALLFALVGGLILNIMPCVLPVLAMKALRWRDMPVLTATMRGWNRYPIARARF